MTVLNTADAIRLGATAVDAIYLGTDLVWSSAATPPGSASATLTVPAGKVAATLTDFVTRVDLAHMPTAWWAAAASDGSNVRVRAAGSDVPVDLVWIDKTRRKGELFFKSTLGTAANVFTVDVVEGATAVAATDPIGRNAVWSAFDLMLAGGSLTNRTGGPNATAVGTITAGEIAYRSPKLNTVTVAAHQGIARDDSGNLYVIDTDEIVKYSPTWTELARNATPVAATGIAGVTHLGDGTVHGGELFIVIETYPSGPYTNQHVSVWDLTTLAFKRSYDISAQGHEVSGITFNPDDGLFYICGYEAADDSVLYRYDVDFNYVGTLALSTPISSKQAVEYDSGAFYVASSAGGTSSTSTNALRRVSADGATVTTLWTGTGGGYLEGITSAGDGTLLAAWYSTDNIYRFTLARGYAVAGSGHLVVAGLPKRTTWTMGVSAAQDVVNNLNRGMLSYSDNSTNNANRASLVARSTAGANFGLWNSTDGYLLDPGTSPSAEINVRHRFHHSQNGTTDRKIWRDGALAATDTGTAQRPAGNGDTLFIGAEDTDAAERYSGTLTYAYLRNGVLSADWLAAEYASWETPASFYTVT